MRTDLLRGGSPRPRPLPPSSQELLAQAQPPEAKREPQTGTVTAPSPLPPPSPLFFSPRLKYQPSPAPAPAPPGPVGRAALRAGTGKCSLGRGVTDRWTLPFLSGGGEGERKGAGKRGIPLCFLRLVLFFSKALAEASRLRGRPLRRPGPPAVPLPPPPFPHAWCRLQATRT